MAGDFCAGVAAFFADFAGDLAGVAAFAGDLAGVAAFAGDFAGVAAFAGDFAGVAAFAGDFAGVAAFKGDFAGVAAFKGDFAGVTAFAGDLAGVAAFTGDLAGVASFAGDFAGAASPLLRSPKGDLGSAIGAGDPKDLTAAMTSPFGATICTNLKTSFSSSPWGKTTSSPSLSSAPASVTRSSLRITGLVLLMFLRSTCDREKKAVLDVSTSWEGGEHRSPVSGE